MSKSKGTGIDPIDVNRRYGTDAMRFTLGVTASVSDVIWTEDRIQSSRNFANKIWNAARFLFVNLDKFEEGGTKLEELAAPEVRAQAPHGYGGSVPLVDAWMFARLAATVELVNEALANYRFHEAAQGVYQFFWRDFCDWYIEWVKPELQNADRERATVARKNLFAVFDAALRLLHPFMPFLTEELWHQLPQKAGAKSIALDQFPEAQDRWKNAKATGDVAGMQEVVTALRTIRAELKVDAKKRVAADFSTSDAGTSKLVHENRGAIERLAVLSELRIVPRHQWEATTGAVRSTATFDVRIAYADTVDMAAEKARLKKEIEGLQKAIESKERQLGDETFRSRAPEKIIKGLEATLAERRIELRKLQDRLSQLDGDS
jgi:valyl-tRNA synthetase